MTSSVDQELIERVRGGDDAAATRLVEMLYPQAARIVRANLPRGEAVEDLLQEVFLRLFTRLRGFRGEAPIEHWLARVAANVCIDRLRARCRRPELRWADLGGGGELLRAALAGGEGGQAQRAADARELVDRLLARLAPEQQLVIRLHELEELPVAEIARRTGWSRVLVRVRAFRARRALRNLIGNLSEEEMP
jgi:RNA polymerase sigma-70 factor (ECF subfamily)